jgi:hypothetical protein
MTPEVDFYFQYCYRSQLGIFHSDCSVIFEIVMARYLFRIEKTTRPVSLSLITMHQHTVQISVTNHAHNAYCAAAITTKCTIHLTNLLA